MIVDSLPIWLLFVITIGTIMAAIEVGYRTGLASHRHSEDEKESPASGVAGAILGLTAFMLAFAFGLASDRFDTRKSLVRDDANALRLTWLRADFLPQPDREQTRRLLRAYLDLRLAFAEEGDLVSEKVAAMRADTDRIQRQLWSIAVANGKLDLNSDVAALYVESLNEVFTVHATRIAVGLQLRIPPGVWMVLFSLIFFGTMSIGYHTGVSGSRHVKSTFILALSFALVIMVIESLDRPGGYAKVTQQPLVDLRSFMAAEK